MLAGRVAWTHAVLAGQVMVIALAHITTQHIARADVELRKAVCKLQDDKLDGD